MAKSENQKVKTLFVAKYFLENSDENHPITAGDIVDYLREECGIEVERRAIYRQVFPAARHHCIWVFPQKLLIRQVPAAVCQRFHQANLLFKVFPLGVCLQLL